MIRHISEVFISRKNNLFLYFGSVQKYHEYNVEVVRKDGLLLVRELAVEVKNHMDFKMNAVMVSRKYFLYFNLR